MIRIVLFLFIIFNCSVYSQNFSRDIILNLYGAGVYTDKTLEKKIIEAEEAKKAPKKNVTPNYAAFSGVYILGALSDYFDSALMYSRAKNVFIRGAIAGETSYMLTVDGRMIPAITKLGDVVARDDKKKGAEEYIIDATSFRYDYARVKNYNNVWAEYIPKPSIRAIMVDKDVLDALNSQINKGFYFYTDEIGQVLVREGDYLLIPLGTDRIYAMNSADFKKMYKVHKQK